MTAQGVRDDMAKSVKHIHCKVHPLSQIIAAAIRNQDAFIRFCNRNCCVNSTTSVEKLFDNDSHI